MGLSNDVSAVKTDASKVEATVKTDVATVEADVKGFWSKTWTSKVLVIVGAVCGAVCLVVGFVLAHL